jgi:hypothetical protein
MIDQTNSNARAVMALANTASQPTTETGFPNAVPLGVGPDRSQKMIGINRFFHGTR